VLGEIMFEINELKSILGSIEDILKLCERCLIHIRIYNVSNQWIVKVGESLLLDTDTYDNVIAKNWWIVEVFMFTFKQEDLNSKEQAIELAKGIGFDITIENRNGHWIVNNKKNLLIITAQEDEVLLFIYGIALGAMAILLAKE
jgi:hypothetical protein